MWLLAMAMESSRSLPILLSLSILASFIALRPAVYAPFGHPISLDSVKTLTLYKDQDTTHRRSSAIPQLTCLGGCEFQPDVVQCENIKSDGKDVLWRCEADLPSHLRFAQTEVICEGYSSAEDERVLEGSCGLEYSLTRTGWGSDTSEQKGTFKNFKHDDKQGWGIGKLMALAVVLYTGYSFYRVCTRREVANMG